MNGLTYERESKEKTSRSFRRKKLRTSFQSFFFLSKKKKNML